MPEIPNFKQIQSTLYISRHHADASHTAQPPHLHMFGRACLLISAIYIETSGKVYSQEAAMAHLFQSSISLFPSSASDQHYRSSLHNLISLKNHLYHAL